MKTWNAKTGEIIGKWWVVDATDKAVGRVATEVAKIIRGKHQPTFTPHQDTGDFVVVLNSDKVKFTGNKWDTKKYYTHSRFFGSLKETTAREQLEKDSTEIIKSAVRGMLPKNRLGNQIFKKLKVYTGSDHPHGSQQPQTLNV